MKTFYVYSDLHITLSDLFYKFWALFWCEPRRQLIDDIRNIWGRYNPGTHVNICYSCRSAFYSLLDALQLEEGTEVVMTGLTIRNMVNIAEYHGLRVVPWDIDISTAHPVLDELPGLLSEKTRMVVITHLFGVKINKAMVGEIVRVAKNYNPNILVVEDMAQSFYQLENNKHPFTDVALFSFGTTKPFTSIKGGILETKWPELHNRIERNVLQFPPANNWKTFRDILVAVIALALLRPTISYICAKLLGSLGITFEDFINKHFTAYPTNGKVENFNEILRKIKMQISTPTLKLMKRRLESVHVDLELRRKQIIGAHASELLSQIPYIIIPGGYTTNRNYWIFSIVLARGLCIAELQDKLVGAGFGASRTATTFGCVTNFVQNKKELDRSPTNCLYFADHVLYLPVVAHIPKSEINRMVGCIREFINQKN